MKNFLKLLFFGISSGTQVVLVFPKTGKERTLGFGFNFTFLLLSSLGGLPLFFKGLWKWGCVMLALTVIDQYLQIQSMKNIDRIMTATDFFRLSENPMETVVTVMNITLSFVLGFKGNQWAAHGLFRRGWVFAKPDEKIAIKACEKWKLSKYYLKKSVEIANETQNTDKHHLR